MNTEWKTLAEPLLFWFEQVARPLPWRIDYQPFQVWISEIMAQQTRMETVVPYFNRFVAEIPDVAALATVDDDRLLKLWEGLGYYSRARNLKKAALLITENFQGQVPQNRVDLESLPGIGPYTAGAILAIAFNQPEPLVDGNIERVFSRLLDVEDNVKSATGHGKIKEAVSMLLACGEPRLLGQALMELGASHCSPKTPDCAACPLLTFCRSHKAENWAIRPVLPERKKTIKQQKVLCVFEHQGRMFVQPQPAGALWAGMLLFPMAEAPEASGELPFWVENHFGVSGELGDLGKFKYSVTCYQVQVQAVHILLEDRPDWEGNWETPEALQALGLPRPSVKALELVLRQKSS